MIAKIRDTYLRFYSHLNLDIISICGQLSNQISDIIVDTNNFHRHPKETLKSEIAWIKKGGNIQSFKRHQKLMFLTKEALWKESLEINETDEELIEKVAGLARAFEEGDVSNKKLFLKKTERYTRVFFDLFEQDATESQDARKNSLGETGNGQQGGSASANGSQEQDGSGGSDLLAGKPKDGNCSDGAAIMIESTENIKDAIEQFAQEASVDDFSEVLSMAGFNHISKKDKERIWFKINSAVMIPIEEFDDNGSQDNYTYPATWRLGDPLENMDMMLTFLGSPIMLPGITTKKWEKSYKEENGNHRKQLDLFLVFDTSGSMGKISDENSRMHQCILTCFGIIAYVEMIKGQIATLGFSNHITVHNEWTNDYDAVRNSMLVNGNGNTILPIRAIENIIESSSNSMVTVLITDGDIHNINEMDNFFRDYLNDGNKLYILILKDGKLHSSYNNLQSSGAQIWQSKTAEGFGRFVINDISA